jgi:predicted patatin/cPLA2 family phospholipase
MNLPLDKTLIAQFAADVNSFSFDKPTINVSTADFENAYAEIFSDKGHKSKLEELRKTGTFPLPKEMQSNIIFSHLTLVSILIFRFIVLWDLLV